MAFLLYESHMSEFQIQMFTAKTKLLFGGRLQRVYSGTVRMSRNTSADLSVRNV